MHLAHFVLEALPGELLVVEGLRQALGDRVALLRAVVAELDQIEGDPDSVLKLAERFGMHAIYAPFVALDGRPSTRSEWSDF